MRINIQWVESEALEQEGGSRLLEGSVGILVPGGFGSRGTRGMMKASEYARTHGIPFFGICYGFQWATVEYARNVCGLDGADSTEVDEAAPHKVIYKLRDLLGVDDLGGTMRLGRYACELAPGSLARKIYGTDLIHERHRHRFEFNCLYEPALAEKGMRISGRSPDGKFVEIAELPGHPWYRRRAVPSGIPVAAAEAASAVCELRRGGQAPEGRCGRTGRGPRLEERRLGHRRRR